jgi:uncharacterized protein (UPF0333 family)
MDNKAQASIEVLLMVGGAIVMALTVGMVLKGMGNQAGNYFTNAAENTAANMANTA